MTNEHKIYEFMATNDFNFIDSRKRLNLKQFLVYKYIKFINLNDDLDELLNISIYDRNKTLIIVCFDNNKNEVFERNHLGHSFIAYKNDKTLTIRLTNNNIFIPTEIKTEYVTPKEFYYFSIVMCISSFVLGYLVGRI